MTAELVVFLFSLVISGVLAAMLLRSVVNTALKTRLSCCLFLDDRVTGDTDLMEGEGFFLNAELENASAVPFPRAELHLNLPGGLRFGETGTANRTVILAIPARSTVRRRFWVNAVRRGAYTMDYAVLVRKKSVLLDLVSFRMPVPAGHFNSVTVYPAVMDLEEHFTTAPYTTGDVEVRRSPVPDPLDFIGVRPLTNEPFSRINWKKSAAAGEWMANENGFTEERDLTILLNLQSRAYERYDSVTGGISSTELTELGISVAASLIDGISAAEVPVRVLFNGSSDTFSEAEKIGEGEHRLSRSDDAASLPDYHNLMRMLARISGGVTVPAHTMFYAVAEEPDRFLAGGNLVVVSPYFDAVMRDFCRSMQALGFEVVFWITSSFSDTEGIPEDVPLYYRTYRGSAEEA